MVTIAKKRLEADAEGHAQESGLRYVHDYDPGFSRKKSGKSFHYFDAAGKKITDEKILGRIKSLVIPPAWEDVWICRYANGHLQATGRDVRGRKQYRYHPKWTESRNETKFQSLKRLAEFLPALRERVEADLKKSGLPKEKVVAAVVKLLELTQIRVGNEEYAAQNDSYGLTTIRNRHVKVTGTQVKFRFKGKSGVPHDVSFRDPRLAKIVRACQDLPGQDLFEYVDEKGEVHNVGSTEVNAYLKEATGGEVTAKALRTWSGTVKALSLLKEMGPLAETTQKARKARELAVIKATAEHLRNTVAVCRKYYIHPAVFEADRKGELAKFCRSRSKAGLSAEEWALAKLCC